MNYLPKRTREQQKKPLSLATDKALEYENNKIQIHPQASKGIRYFY